MSWLSPAALSMVGERAPSRLTPMASSKHAAERVAAVAALALASVAIAACGGGDESTTETASGGSTFTQQPEAAANPSADDFPAADGKTLKQLASQARPGLVYAPGTQTYAPGENRVAFGLLNQDNEIVYAPTAVYVARTPVTPAKGPFLAPSDSLITEAPYRSRNAATEADPFASIYGAEVPLPRAGAWSALILSRADDQLLGATARYRVSGRSAVPAVGDPAPQTHTDTTKDVGNIAEIDTRVPPDDMHGTDVADVVGERPVALLFATPALCESRVCGPVTDIAEQLKTEYGDRIEFIHQEVYADNDPSKGLRPPLADYGLRSEPWLFAIDADGRIAARLEGSFGLNAFEAAVQKAIG